MPGLDSALVFVCGVVAAASCDFGVPPPPPPLLVVPGDAVLVLVDDVVVAVTEGGTEGVDFAAVAVVATGVGVPGCEPFLLMRIFCTLGSTPGVPG